MVRETFYEALSSEKYSKAKFQELLFKMEERGPEYRIILTGTSSNPIDSIVSNNYLIKKFKGDHNITGSRVKRNMLNLLFHEVDKI
ncbi:MAG: hypothetical protein ACP5NZ_05135 [Nanobdellota archaeon]